MNKILLIYIRFCIKANRGRRCRSGKASRVKSGRLYRCDRGGRYKAGLVMINMMDHIISIAGNYALSSLISPLGVSKKSKKFPETWLPETGRLCCGKGMQLHTWRLTAFAAWVIPTINERVGG